MHGSPLLRALILTVSLAIMGLLIASQTRKEPPAADTTEPVGEVTTAPAVLSLQLSAPAKSLRLTTIDGTAILLEHTQPPLNTDTSLELPIPDNTFTGLLTVVWESPGNNNFLRLRLEPEQLESRELILHAPTNLEEHAIEFTWPTE